MNYKIWAGRSKEAEHSYMYKSFLFHLLFITNSETYFRAQLKLTI